MNDKTPTRQTMVCILVLLSLVACGAPTPEAESVPTDNLPTSLPARVLITSPEPLIGTWESVGAREDWSIRFNEDGTCVAGYRQEDLDTNPNVQCNYAFEGDRLVLLVGDVVRGVPACGYEGRYEIISLSENRIKFIPIVDPCYGRARSMYQEFIRLP